MGLPEQVFTNPNASWIALGLLNARGLVVMRTTALNTNGDNPNRASPDTTATSHARHIARWGKSLRNA